MSKLSPRLQRIILIGVIVLIGILWVLFFYGYLPGNAMDTFCYLLLSTVLFIILMFNWGRGAFSQRDGHDESADRFGKSF